MTTVPSPFAVPTPAALTIKPNQMRGVRSTTPNGVVSPDDGWPVGNWRDTAITVGDIVIQVVVVTPEVAQHWVDDTIKRNRTRVESRVTMYARDMENGAWDFNADPIRLDVHGNLIDGQHRAKAVVKAGVPELFLLVTGLPPEAQITMDSGRPRSVADMFGIKEETNTNMLASITRRLALFKRGVPATGGGVQLSKTEHMGFLDNNPQVRRAVEVGKLAAQQRVPVAPSVLGAAYFLCAEVDREAAETFFVTNLIKSMGISDTDEYHPARTLLRRFRAEASGGGERIESELAFRFILQAWNAWREKRSLQRMMTPPHGWSPYSEIKIK